MTPDTLNIWLSTTKPLTAAAFALLWQRGLADLDHPVARYIPEFGNGGKEAITIRHLLTHTAGIRMLNVGWPEASWDEILAKICATRIEPRWVPGQKAGYHLSSSFFVLGELIARLAGEPFRDFVRRELFEQLGMENCCDRHAGGHVTWPTATASAACTAPSRSGCSRATGTARRAPWAPRPAATATGR